MREFSRSTGTEINIVIIIILILMVILLIRFGFLTLEVHQRRPVSTFAIVRIIGWPLARSGV